MSIILRHFYWGGIHLNSKKEYENILLQEYQISDIEQLIAQYCRKIEISIFCVSWNAAQINKKLALSIHENPNKSP